MSPARVWKLFACPVCGILGFRAKRCVGNDDGMPSHGVVRMEPVTVQEVKPT